MIDERAYLTDSSDAQVFVVGLLLLCTNEYHVQVDLGGGKTGKELPYKKRMITHLP